MNPQLFAVQLSQAVESFASPSPDATEQQKSALRGLVALVKTEGVFLKCDDAGLEIGGTRIHSPAAASLVRQLKGHGIGEVRIARGAPPADVFNLLKALSQQPGSFSLGDGVEVRLRTSSAHSITVIPEPPPETGENEAVTKREELNIKSSEVTASADGITRADDFALEHAPEAPPPARAPRPSRDFVITHSTEDFAEQHEALMPARPDPVPPPSSAAPPAPGGRGMETQSYADSPAPVEGTGTLDALAAQIAGNPKAPNIGDLLARAGTMVDELVRKDRIEQAIDGLSDIIAVEGKLTEGSERRQFGIMLKRAVTRSVLQAASRLVAHPQYTTKAVGVLQRAGADGTEVLLELLIAAPTVSERRTFFDALRNMKEGASLLVHHLAHHEWFVVRNVAELAGELGLEEALPELAKLLSHEDVRVRKAAALAVAKIGTSKSLDPLRRALKDESVEVRTQVAVGIGGRKSSALAMPLVVALEEEKDATVQRELILALGRIGTPDAVQALIKLAEPSGGLFKRKPSLLRIAAVEALALVGSPAARGMLEGLAKDGDREVKEAAQRAVRASR
jgi:HEAT repeat protein/PBS lyase HEAT-like repeat-containing protein